MKKYRKYGRFCREYDTNPKTTVKNNNGVINIVKLHDIKLTAPNDVLEDLDRNLAVIELISALEDSGILDRSECCNTVTNPYALSGQATLPIRGAEDRMTYCNV